MKSLRDRIKEGTIPSETINCPDWGRVTVRGLTGKERDQFDSKYVSAQQTGNYEGLRAWSICRTVIDDEGKRVFEDGDEAMINEAPGRAVDFVFNSIKKLSGLTDQDVEDLEKNSNGEVSA